MSSPLPNAHQLYSCLAHERTAHDVPFWMETFDCSSFFFFPVFFFTSERRSRNFSERRTFTSNDSRKIKNASWLFLRQNFSIVFLEQYRIYFSKRELVDTRQEREKEEENFEKSWVNVSSRVKFVTRNNVAQAPGFVTIFNRN